MRQPYSNNDRPAGADILPTAQDISPAPLISPAKSEPVRPITVDPDSLESQLPMMNDQSGVQTAATPFDYDDSYRHPKHRTKLFIGLFLLAIGLISAGGFGLNAYVSHVNKQKQAATNQNADIKLPDSLTADNQNQTLHINFNTLLGGGKGLTATGSVLVQNSLSAGFVVQDTSGSNLLVADNFGGKVGIGQSPTGSAKLQVNGNISVNGDLLSASNAFGLSPQGLSINGVLVCTAAGCTNQTVDLSPFARLAGNNNFSGINKFSSAGNVFTGDGSGLSALDADNVTSGTLSDNRLSANVALLGSNNTFSGSNTFSQQIQASGGLNASAYSVGGTPGSSLTCTSGDLVQNAVIQSGIITGGSCVAGAGASVATLQESYDASVPPTIVLNSVNGLIQIQDAASALGTDLFEVTNNGGGVKYFAVSANGISVTGNINTTGQYQVNGSQISSANLSNDANLAKLNGTQTFTNANTFSNAGNSFTGNGSGLTSLNASNVSSGTLNDARLSGNVTLAGNTFNGNSELVQLTSGGILPVLNGSNLTALNAGNVTSGTLSDNRLSANVALLNANNIFLGDNSFHLNSTALTVQDAASPLGTDLFTVTDHAGTTKYFEVSATGAKVNGNDVCTSAGNCTGVSGGAIGGGGTAGTIPVFTGTGFTIGDSTLSQSAGNLTATGNISIATGKQYQVNGSQISSANLSNDSNLAKLNGSQTFTNANTFSSASNSFTGDGSGLSNVNAAQLNGQAGSYYTNASNISSGTLSDSRLSSNVALLNGANSFTGNNTFTLNTAGLAVQDAASPLGTNLFEVDNNNGTTKYFEVSATGAKVNGNDVCTSAGNCTGVSGGAIGGSGTTGKLAEFTGSGYTIGDSLLSDNGSAISDSGDLNVTGTLGVNTIAPTATLTVGVSTQTLVLQGDASTKLTAKAGSVTNSLVFAAPTVSNKTITIPDATGTVAVSASGPLALDAAGNLTCPTCLTSGGGGSGGVSSVNTLNGAITLAGTAHEIIITPSSNTLTFSTPQDIDTSSSPTFANINVTGQYEVGGSQISSANLSNDANLAKLNGSQTFTNANTFSSASNSFTGDGSGLSNVNAAQLNGQAGSYYTNASNISSGTLSDSRLSSNVALLNGTGPQTFTGNNEFNGTVLAADATNSTTAFQVQNASAATIFNVDTSTSQNLITNGGFEGAGTAGWTAKGSATISLNSNLPWQGNNSLEVDGTATDDGASYAVTLSPSTQYTLSFWARNNGSPVTVSIGRQEQSGTDINCAVGQVIASSNSWSRFSCSFTTGLTISSSNVYVKKPNTGSETFFLDGVQLETGGSATAFNAGGAIQLSGYINSPVVLQNKSNSVAAFQIQNAAGVNDLSFDTVNDKLSVVGDINANTAIQTNNSTRIDNSGNLTNIGNFTASAGSTFATTGANGFTFKPGSDLATAFQIQSAGAADTLLTVDTTARGASGGNLVKIGNSTGTDGNTTILVVDSAASAPTSDLSALNGGLFYNTSTNHIDVIENGLVKELCNKTDLGCGSAGTTQTLATVYANGSSQADETIALDSTRNGVLIRDNSTPLGGTLFGVQDSTGSTKYLDVTAAGISVAGTVTASGNINTTSGIYEVGGSQISSANLSNDSNLAKLNGTQTFTNANTFSSASNSFTGDGSGLSNLNASNVASGTLNDGRLSSNVALLNANNAFTNTNAFQATSATAFQLQSSGAAETLLTANTNTRTSGAAGNEIVVGNATGTDTNTTILVLDSATAAPTTNLGSLNGGLFYNSTTNHINVIENGVVKELCNKTDLGCGSAGATQTLAVVYANGASQADETIGLDSTRNGVLIRDNATPIGSTLFGVQNSTGGTKYLDVTSSGISVAGTIASTGNINTSGGALQTNGTTRIDNSGNLTNIGNLSLSGTISGGTTVTGSGNFNSTGGALQTNSTTRIDNSGNLTNIGNLTSTAGSTFATTGANGFSFKPGSDNNSAFQLQNSSGLQLLNLNTVTSASNLITNPGFEINTTGWAARNSATISRNTSAAFAGVASGEVDTTAAVGDGISYAFTFLPSTTYTFTIYGMTASGTAPINLGYVDNIGHNCTTNYTLVSGGWTQMTCTFTTGGTISGSGVFVKQQDATARTFYVDTARLEQAAAPSAQSIAALSLNAAINSPTLLQNATDSTDAFQIQNAAGTSNLFIADTLDSEIGINGPPVAGGAPLQVFSSSQSVAVATAPGGAIGITFNNVNSTKNTYIHLLGSSNGGLGFCANTTSSTCAVGTEQFQLAAGGAATFKNSTNSATAFQIQNSGAADTLLTANTNTRTSGVAGNELVVGNATGTDVDTTILVLDSATAVPTTNLGSLNGGLFYNSTTNHINVVENGIVKELCNKTDLGCGSAVTPTLVQVYGYGASQTDETIGLDSTRNGVLVRDNATPIGGTLFGVQNSTGATKYLDVTSSGITVAGTIASTGNINTSGGTLQTNGTTRIDNSGNLTNIGNISLSGTISGGTTVTGSGNFNSTGGSLQTNSTTRVDNSGNLTNIGNFTASTGSTFATTGANGFTFKPGTDNTTAFQIQNAGGTDLFNVDSSDNFVINNGTTTPNNLLQNPGFESSTASGASGWTLPTGATINNDGNAHTGNQEVAMAGNSNTYEMLTSKFYAVTPGDTIDLQAWLKNAAGTNGHVSLEAKFFDKNYVWNTTFSGVNINPPGTSYTLEDFSHTVPGGSVYMQVGIEVDSSSTTGTWYADDMLMNIENDHSPAIFQNSTDSTAAFQVQNAAGKNYLLVNTSGASVSLGNTGIASSVQIGNTTGAVAQTIGVGNNSTGSSTTTLTLGSTIGSSTTNIQGGSGGITLKPSGASSSGVSVTLQNASTNAFQVQNNGSSSVLSVDTTGNGNITVGNASNPSTVRFIGGATASRPASPAQGQLYYDTSTSNLIQYNGSKWVSAPKSNTVIIAASNSTQAEKDAADYVATGTDDGSTINTALSALPSGGGSVYLMEGTYTLGTTAISVPDNTTLEGSGSATLLKYANNVGSGTYNAITNSDTTTGTNITIQNLMIDGNASNQSAGTFRGIYFSGMGAGSGTSARDGAKVINVVVKNSKNTGIYLNNSLNNTITDSTILTNAFGVYTSGSSNNTFTGNTVQGNSNEGIELDSSSSSNTVSSNTLQGNTPGSCGLATLNSSNNNTATGNTANGNGVGICIWTSNNTVTGNTLQGNLTGLQIHAATNNTATGNVVSGNSSEGIQIDGASDNTVSANNIYDNGGSTDNNGIYLSSSSTKNSITGNDMTESSCTTTCYAINISDSGSTGNYLSSNHFLGDGTHAATINDATAGGNTYSNQPLTENGDASFRNAANSTTAFQVQTAAGSSIFNIDTSNNLVGTAATSAASTNSAGFNLQTGNATGSTSNSGNVSIDVGTATGTTGTLSIGTANASGITIGKSSGSAVTTINGGGGITLGNNTTISNDKSFSAGGTADFEDNTNSATAFQIQNSGAADTLLSVNSLTRTSGAAGNIIKIGNSTGTDTNTTILVLDSTTSAPTTNLSSLNGGLFYNSTTNKVEEIENGVAKVLCNQTDLGCGAGATTTLQNTYDESLGGATPEIVLNNGGTDTGGIDIQDGTSPVSGNLFDVQNNGGSVNYLAVAATGVTVSSLTSTGIITANGGISVAAGQSIVLNGGITSSRPGSPTKGTLYYDTSTNNLIQYNGSKWISAPRSNTVIIAASNSTQAEKDAADYVATGAGDQSTINTALSALPSGDGTVYLMEGTYTLSAAISVPDNTTLTGAGAATIITVPNSQNGTYNMIANSDTSTGTNVTISSLLIDGNKANQTSGAMRGIFFSGMGSGSGTSARSGGKITSVTVKNIFNGNAVTLSSSSNNTLSGNTLLTNGSDGIALSSSSNNTIGNNIAQGNATGIGLGTSSNANTITGNTVQGNTSEGIYVDASNNNTVSSNTTQGNTQDGISLDDAAADNTITGNTSNGNTNGAGVVLSRASINNTITGNTTQADFYGIQLWISSDNAVTGNTIVGNSYGIYLDGNLGSAINNTISGNTIQSNGGGSTNNGIYLVNSATKNSITGNNITDTSCTSTCYAINISDSGSTGNYLSSNHFLGGGGNTASINDTTSGGNTYSNQPLTENGDASFRNAANSTTAFQVQSASGAQLLNADSSNMRLGVDVTYTTMSVPTSLAAAIASGGALGASSTYKYEVTAIDSAGGETTVSNEVTCTTGTTTCSSGSLGTNKTINLTWNAVTGASAYKVYRTAAGGGTGTEDYLTTVLTNSFSDSGAITQSSTAPPSTANAYYASSNNSTSELQLTVGGEGTPTGQVYVSGAQPTLVGQSTDSNLSNSNGLVVQGKYAYVTAFTNNKLAVYDISNPAAPLFMGSSTTSLNGPNGIAVQGKYAYIANQTGNNIQVFDISNPNSPTHVGQNSDTVLSGPSSLYVTGHYLYVTTGGTLNKIAVYDISNPAAPTLVGESTTDTNAVGGPITSYGKFLYVESATNTGLDVYDISNPTQPTSVGSKTGLGTLSIRGLKVVGRYAYIISTNTLNILDVGSGANPVLVGQTSTNLSGPSGLAIQGRYAYVTNQTSNKLTVFDISDPYNPVFVSQNSDSAMNSPKSIEVVGRYAYVINAGGNNLTVYDLGGTYTQQLEAGGAEFGALSVDGTGKVGGDFVVQGALSATSLQTTGNISVNGGANVQGSSILAGGNNALGAPTISSVVCSSGSGTTWGYKITAINSSGGETTASAEVQQTCTASLDAGHANTISWSAVTGASGYKVYRTTAGGTPSSTGLIGNTTLTSFADTGLTGAGNAAPTTDTTGQLTVQGSVLFANNTNSATAFQIQNSGAADTLLSVNSLTRTSGAAGNIIKIGNSTGTDTSTTILVLDSTTSAPTTNLSSLNGGLFYNSTTNKVEEIENGVAKVLCNQTDGFCGGNSTTLQQAYDASAAGTIPEIVIGGVTNTTGVDIQNTSTASITGASLFTVRDKAINNSTLGTALFNVSDKGETTIRTDTNSTTAFQIQNAGGATTLLDADTSNLQINITGKEAVTNNAAANTFPSTPVLDNFNRASLGTNWTSPAFGTNAASIIGSTQLGETASGNGDAAWNVSKFGPDTEVYVDVPTLPTSGDSVSLIYRANVLSPTATGYLMAVTPSTNTWALYNYVGGSPTLICTYSSATALAAGDSIGASVVGNTHAAWKKHAGAWSQVGSNCTDSTYTTPGYIGVTVPDTTLRLDNFGGGSINNTFTASNSSSTSNIAVFENNNSAVATIFNNGGVLFQNSTNSTSAFQIQDTSGYNYFNVDTVNNTVSLDGNLTTADQINLGNTSGHGQNIDIGLTGSGNGANNSNVSIATNQNSGATNTITIGYFKNTNSSVTIEAGNTGGINLGDSNNAHTINIGNGGTSTTQTVNIGSTSSASALLLQAGTGNIKLAPSGSSNSGVVLQPSTADSTAAFQIQNQAGTTNLFTADTSGLIITIAGNTTNFAELTLTNAHFKSTQTTAPTIGTPTNCATTPTAAVTAGSTDSAGSFTITAGTGGGETTCDTVVTFNKAYGAAPKSVIITPTKSVGTSPVGKSAIVTNVTSTTFTIQISSPPADSEVNSYYYWVIE